MRLHRILAVAERDLRIELAGRRGMMLPAIAVSILLPIALAPPLPPEPLHQGDIVVGGDVPEDVATAPRVVHDDARAVVWIDAPDPGEDRPTIVRSDFLPDAVRESLDATHPGVKTVIVQRRIYEIPQRSLLLSLVAASILTGSIAQSLPGERSQRTLEGLLTASITRMELITGKWLAWGGFGAAFSMAATAVALLLGRQEPGWWILPVPTVSMATAAAGFLLVRRARDVVGGATVAIRVLPAAIAVLGLTAWILGRTHPLLGASLPLGGALVAAGDTWEGPLPPIVATLSTLLASALCLVWTARDLDPELPPTDGLSGALWITAGLAAAGWWAPLLAPLTWAVGGSPELLDSLPVRHGVLAGATAFALLVLIRGARSARPTADLGLTEGRPAGYVAALVGAILLTAWTLIPPLPPGLWADASARMSVGLAAVDAPVTALVAACGQELLLRGWMRRHTSDLTQIALSAMILCPLDPLRGLVLSGLCTVAVRLGGGSVGPAIVLRALHLLVLTGLAWPG